VADERLEHVLGQVVDDLPVDVVLDVQEAVDVRVGGVDGAVPDVLADLDLVGLGVQVTLGVEVEVGDMVAQVIHYLLAEGRAAGVGRAHVGREEAEDVVDGDLVVHHLIDDLLLRQLGSILVRPAVAGDLVAFIVHSPDDVRPGSARVVDLTLADVGTGDEEGCLGVVLGEQVQEVVCVQVRPVVIRDGDVTRVLAAIDTRAAVGDRADARTRDVPRIRAIGDLVGIAARTVVDLAVRGIAVLGPNTAPACRRAAIALLARRTTKIRTTARGVRGLLALLYAPRLLEMPCVGLGRDSSCCPPLSSQLRQELSSTQDPGYMKTLVGSRNARRGGGNQG